MSEQEGLNPVEQEAVALGWQPEEDFKADPKNEGKRWRSAEDFMDRQPLFDKIEHQNRELKAVKQALNHLTQHNQKIEKLAYERALQELKASKVQALEEDDHQKVVEIDEKIQELKTVQAQPQPQQPNEAFVAWVEKNEWYKNDKEMRSIADGIGLSLAREGVPPEEIMTQVSERIKKVYPEKFGKTRVPPNPDSGGSRKSNSGSNVEALLTPNEVRIMNTIVQTGLSKEEYLKQFVATQPERFKGVKL